MWKLSVYSRVYSAVHAGVNAGSHARRKCTQFALISIVLLVRCPKNVSCTCARYLLLANLLTCSHRRRRRRSVVSSYSFVIYYTVGDSEESADRLKGAVIPVGCLYIIFLCLALSMSCLEIPLALQQYFCLPVVCVQNMICASVILVDWTFASSNFTIFSYGAKIRSRSRFLLEKEICLSSTYFFVTRSLLHRDTFLILFLINGMRR